MKTILTLIMFASGIACTSLAAQETTHRFIAFGQKTYMIGADGKPTWTYPHATRDGYVLDNGNIVLTLSKGKRYPGGAVIQIDPDGKESLIWKGTQSEVNSAQPTTNGTFVITEAGANPRLLEVDRSGTVFVEFTLQCQKQNHHLQTRMARKLADGTYLVPHLLDFAVIHYDVSGKVLRKIDTSVPGDSELRGSYVALYRDSAWRRSHDGLLHQRQSSRGF